MPVVSPKAIGGTHSSVERAWRAKGMVGPFIQTDLNGNAKMDMSLADIVLFALHELYVPDQLVAARHDHVGVCAEHRQVPLPPARDALRVIIGGLGAIIDQAGA